MNVFPLIYCPIILYAFKSYHKAFLLYAVMRPFLNVNIPIYSTPGLPQLYLETIITTFMFMCVSFNSVDNKFRTIPNSARFPLKIPFIIFIALLYISTIMYPLFSFFPLASILYNQTMNNFIFVYLLWRELRTRQDIQFFIKGIMIVSSIAILYGFFEKFSDFYNPLMIYESTLNQKIDTIGGNEDTIVNIRGNRVSSIFYAGLGCGAYMATVFAFFYYINTQYRSLWTSPKWLKIMFMVGLLFTLLFANSRGAMLYFAISLFCMLKFKSVLRLSLFLPFIFIFYEWIEPYLFTIKSIVDTESADTGGSTFAMRWIQFSTTIQIAENRPWLGYGAGSDVYWPSQYPELLGVESIWLKLLLTQGIIGIISYLYLLYSLVRLGLGKSKRYVIGAVLAFIILRTTTVAYGFDQYESFQIGFLLIAYRLELLSKSEERLYGAVSC